MAFADENDGDGIGHNHGHGGYHGRGGSHGPPHGKGGNGRGRGGKGRHRLSTGGYAAILICCCALVFAVGYFLGRRRSQVAVDASHAPVVGVPLEGLPTGTVLRTVSRSQQDPKAMAAISAVAVPLDLPAVHST